MNRDALRRRYVYLWTGEATAALLCVTCLFWFAYDDGVWQRWIVRSYSTATAVFILWQGTTWWRWKLRALQSDLEQINYYYVQLMYDSSYDWRMLRRHGRLRRGTIARAVESLKELEVRGR